LGQTILDALAASGKHLEALTIDDLAPLDQFHGGGKGATVRLARLAGLTPGMRVLDVGGGLGGPAPTPRHTLSSPSSWATHWPRLPVPVSATATRAASSWCERCSTGRHAGESVLHVAPEPLD
jgi:hypothetical protein